VVLFVCRSGFFNNCDLKHFFRVDQLQRICQRPTRLGNLQSNKELNMSLKKSAMAAIAAVSLVAVPAMASAAQSQSAASKLSVRAVPAKVVRAGAAQRDASGLGGGSVIMAILAAVAVAVGIAIAADGSNGPTSP
jgi:hypothetical protein